VFYRKFETTGCIDLVFGRKGILGLSYSLLKGLGINKDKVLPSEILSKALNLADFSALSPLYVYRRKYYQLSLIIASFLSDRL